jgi:hypothetical protein
MEKLNESIEVSQYMELYRSVLKQLDSREAAVAIVQEFGKDRRLRAIQNAKGVSMKSEDSSTGASEKQKNYLRRLGVDFDERISKAEASRLIDESLEGGA